MKAQAFWLFDKATGALNTPPEKKITARLREVSKAGTPLFIAHRLSTVVDADEFIVFDQGRITEPGRHAELIAMDGRYADMWRKQQEAALLQQRLETELVGA
uniref:ABC-type transport system involved in Fe-S cluster assembly, permease and ATPase components n=1 Tax=Magnetospirillum gryphiswaldense TaxID=55518 RepID=A4TTK9_9PROT|nr:ABC-type transport system involved in Fe-S cluster assembly, permease and ATPase components [Magnetospirillum gryphiswaldense MSR-1]